MSPLMKKLGEINQEEKKANRKALYLELLGIAIFLALGYVLSCLFLCL